MIRTFKNETGSPEVKIRRESPVIAGARLYPGTSISFTEADWENLPNSEKRLLEAGLILGAYTLEETDLMPASGPVPTGSIKKEAPVFQSKIKTEEPIKEKESEKGSDETVVKSDTDDSGKTDDDDSGKTEEQTSTDDTVKDNEMDSNESKAAENEDASGKADDGQKIEKGSGEGKPDESKSDSDKSEKLEKVSDSVGEAVATEKKDEKPKEKIEEIDNFNYAEFLNVSIAKIKIAYGEMAEEDRPSIDKLIAAEEAGENRSGLVAWLRELLS